jgi:mRNA interferase RelE/StbE
MTEAWRVIILRAPKKTIAKLPRDLRERVEKAIDNLAFDPRPNGCRMLTGYDLYRIRVGDWRVIYAIEDNKLIFLVVDVAPRGDAYRNL